MTSIRNTDPYEGAYQIVAFQNSSIAAVLFMADQTDGQVAIVHTSTMAVSSTVPVSELPFALTPDETGTTPVLWVSYMLAAGGENVSHIGEISQLGFFSPLPTLRQRVPVQRASWTRRGCCHHGERHTTSHCEWGDIAAGSHCIRKFFGKKCQRPGLRKRNRASLSQ